ncbi:hypothetical protein [Mycobacterium sp. GA-1841]|uniref:hypothetical protein n=1 Tax=Mycobacterium sp. GA-1841 TaxID=1834154 RepID=UPI001115871A|nr:hypothetical protein [Mycobacterium sp. GA-1841]
MNRTSKPVSLAAVLTGAVAAIGTAAGIIAAPSAFAAPAADCSHGGGSVVCQTPGNAEVYSVPPSTTPGMGIGSNGPYGPWGNVPPLR